MVKDRAAAHYLADALCDLLFAQPGPTRLSSLLSGLPASCPAGPALATEVMEDDSRFGRCATRWDLAHRFEMTSRPLGGALDALLKCAGRPMPRSLLVAELCLQRPGDPVQNSALLDRLLVGSRDFAASDDLFYLTAWLPRTAAADDASLLYINGLSTDETFLALRAKLQATTVKHRGVLDTAEAALKLARQGLSNRALGLVLHHHHGERFEAAETLLAMYADSRFLCLSGPTWLLATQEKALSRELVRAAAKDPAVEPPAVDLEALAHAESGQRMKLEPAVAEQIRALAGCVRTPVDLEEVLTDLMGLRPRQRQFVPAAQAAETLLGTDMALLRVGTGRYLPRQGFPQWVRTIPEVLLPELPQTPLLALEDLAPGLAERVSDPYYEDQGEREVAVGQDALDETRVPVAIHHQQCGTLKLRQQDRRLFDVPGPLAVVTFITPEGAELPVWVNTETRLLYGLLVWFRATLPPAGALLEIHRVPERAETYRLVYEGATDAGTYVGKDRLAQLQGLRDRLRRKRATLVDALVAVLSGSRKGLVFDQLWAQVNVIYRVTRLQVASVLTAEARFTPGDGGRWRVS